MNVEGRCHCGAIQFQATVDPQASFICHCLDCQTVSGSAFRLNVSASAEGFWDSKLEPQICWKFFRFSGLVGDVTAWAPTGSPLFATGQAKLHACRDSTSVALADAEICRRA
jgi:hypothetical protein